MSVAAAYPTVNRNTHSIALGYLFWLFGFLGMHRFYYGKRITGTIWFSKRPSLNAATAR